MSGLPPAPAGFLDAVGGLPMASSVAAAYARAAELAWADPVRFHHLGRQSALVLDTARASLATGISHATGASIGAEQVFFAPNMRMAALWAGQGFLGAPSFLASAIETLALIDGLSEHDPGLRTLGVDSHGFLDQSVLADLGPSDGLVLALQAANVEIGTSQDLNACSAAGFRLLVDASQCLGRIPLGTNWSLLLAAASDWGGPVGVVVLAVQPNTRWSCPLPTVGGWIGSRADVPAVVAAATALELTLPEAQHQSTQQFALIDRLRTSIRAAISDVTFAGDEHARLPHILNCSILYVSGEALVLELDRRGFAVATGSACVADSDHASHVLAAIGGFTGGNLRISLPFDCTEETADSFVDALVEVVAELRRGTGL
ncbi:MAG: aminotransferase class V-fold PLP-dependent enzyme [Actinomycetota bacterium]|nr:aminotransferase class V-fold PLP-dependent enzyme [Actinomycetota bacterium]